RSPAPCRGQRKQPLLHSGCQQGNRELHPALFLSRPSPPSSVKLKRELLYLREQIIKISISAYCLVALMHLVEAAPVFYADASISDIASTQILYTIQHRDHEALPD